MTALERLESAPLRRSVFRARLPIGLEVIVAPTPGFQKTFAVIGVRYGSVQNEFEDPETGRRVRVPDGVAHFLEHKLFEGADGRDVSERFAETGAATNAFTWYNQTAYLFSATEAFERNLGILLDFVQSPRFTPERVEVEKGIIGQEIRMYEDNPGARGFRNLVEALYRVHPVRLEITGTVETISAITADVLRLCHRAFYHPANMVLVAAGDLDPAAVLGIVERDLSGRAYRAAPRVRTFPTDEPEGIPARHVEAAFSIARPRLLLGVRDRPPGRGGPELVRRDLAAACGLACALGRSSEAYDRWYREGLVDDSFGFSYSSTADFALTVVAGDTDEPERLRDEILAVGARVAREGVPEEDVERSRRAFLGRYLRAWNSPEALAHAVLGNALLDTDAMTVPDMVLSLRADEVAARAAAALDADRHAVSILRPLP